eukprot:2156683-Lingulodinium_polyedra.AAC.1
MSILPATYKMYAEVWGEIKSLAVTRGLVLSAETADVVLASWMEAKFMEGWNISQGNRGIAAVKFFLP